MIQNRWTNS